MYLYVLKLLKRLTLEFFLVRVNVYYKWLKDVDKNHCEGEIYNIEYRFVTFNIIAKKICFVPECIIPMHKLRKIDDEFIAIIGDEQVNQQAEMPVAL